MKMGKKKYKPIDVKVADMSDEELNAIIQLRKKIDKPEKREAYIRGLYYISNVDSDYSEAEKALVEGSACALGINREKLDEIISDMESNKKPVSTFSAIGDKKFKDMLFEEMGMLTYLKGYQLMAEDKALKKVAKEMDIPEEKAEKKLLDLYMRAQGAVPSKSLASKVALGAGGIVIGAAICAVSAGVAAPAIGALIGSSMGLSGAAASSAGLALLGGGSLAAGGGGVAAGTAAVVATGAVVGGGGAAAALSVKENIAGAYDKKTLKAVIKKQQKDNLTKQQITENLIKAIETQKARLVELEKMKVSKRDIASVKLQIANLEASKAELELEMGE